MQKETIDCSNNAERQTAAFTAEEVAAFNASSQEEGARLLKSSACVALLKSDTVAIRCVKAGIEFPADWQQYVSDLRAVIRGHRFTMPKTPSYPEGT